MEETVRFSPARISLKAGLRQARPLLLAALGMFSLADASAQSRRLQAPTAVATRVSLPATSAVRPAAALPTRPARRGEALIASTATGGDWSAATTWVGGVVPAATDDVTIASGATVTLDVAASCASLTVEATASLLTSTTTSYQLQVAGSVTNNGTLDLSNTTAIGSDLRFTGAGSATFGGSGTTDLQSMSLAKAVRADVVEMTLPTLSVKGSATSGDGFLLTRTTGTTPADDMTGTLKISGSGTISNKVFGNAPAYILPATGSFWLNNANFTVLGQTGTSTVNGLLRISAGTYNVGTSSGNSLVLGAASALTVEGGTLTSAGRITSFTSATTAVATTFTLSGGTINVANVGNASGTPSFGINGITTISGGTINLVQRSTATTPLDYYVAGTYNYTGGTVNVGTAATATNFDFRIRGSVPNLTLDNTTNPKSALLQGQTNGFGTVLITPGTNLNLNGQLLLQLGATITNNGTFTGTTASSTLYFAGSVPQTLGGSGTFTTIRTISVDNNGGGATLTVPVVTTRVNMFTGNLNGTNNLTIGDGTAAFFVIQLGVTGNTTTSGSFATAPTFNIGSGALQLIYAPETTARTTGFEIPSTRIVDGITVSNPAGVILAGGNLKVNDSGVSNASLVLTSGILTTSAANTLVLGTAAATIPTGSATSYVRGPLGITVNSATAVNRTFAVGDAAGWRPVVVTGTTAATDQIFTATVVNGATGGTGVSPVTGLNPTRYVRLENSANLPATARVQLSYGADDVLGNAATASVAQAATAAGAYTTLWGAAATAPTTGIVSTLDLTPGNDFFVLANTEGGTLAASALTVCSGANSGTLTLTGNVGTITGYEANTGSGFVAVPGTNTGATLAFSNLTATTTFRAVILTADNRTVYSAPVTVTVEVAPTATLTAATATTFCGPGTLTLNATAVAGATYQFLLDGQPISGATSATYTTTATASGSYSVVVSSALGCSATSTAIAVTVNPATTATFSYASNTLCVSGSAATPTVTGTAGGTFSSTTGLTIDATTGAITPSTSTPGTYTVTYSVGGACPSSATASVTITTAPVATFSYAATGFCASQTATAAPVFGAGASAGTFSSTAGLTLNAATGAITPSTSTPGTYVVTNSIAAAGGCAAATATFSVTITAAPVATFSYAATSFCTSQTTAAAATLATGSTAGTFSSTTGLTLDATTGAITPSTSTPGTYTVTNTVAASGACAVTTATASVTITAAPVATFSYAAAGFCASQTATAAPVLGTGASAGTFTSTTGLTINATTGAITPSTSTPGTYVVTNTVAAAGACAAATATFSVTITAAPVATFSYANAAYCVGGTGTAAPTLAAGATAGTFSSTTGLTIDATTGVINLATSTAGTYTVTNTVAASGACAVTTATFSVTINARPAQPTVAPVYNGATTTLTSSSTTGNQWFLNGTLIPGATNPTYVVNTTAQFGQYTVVVTNAATGCASLPSAPLLVNSSVKPLAGSALSVYPNPTVDGNVSVELRGYSKATELRVYNAVGQQVLERTLPGQPGVQTATLDLRQLPAGVYILRARTEGGLDVRRITKQ
jgi:hypothetical protein